MYMYMFMYIISTMYSICLLSVQFYDMQFMLLARQQQQKYISELDAWTTWVERTIYVGFGWHIIIAVVSHSLLPVLHSTMPTTPQYEGENANDCGISVLHQHCSCPAGLHLGRDRREHWPP